MKQAGKIQLDLTLPEFADTAPNYLQTAIVLGAETYAAGLMEDMDIKSEIEVSLNFRSENRKPFDMVVNGQDARLDLTAAVTDWPSHICTEIYRNRELFVCADKPRAKAGKAFRKVEKSRRLVRQNWPVNFAQENQQPLAYVRLSTESYLDHWKIDQEESALMAVQKAFFNATGLPCSLPMVTTDDRLGKDEFQITLNKLRLPVHQFRGEDSIAEITDALKLVMLNTAGCFLTREILGLYLNQIRPLMPKLIHFVQNEIGIDLLYEIIIQLIEEGICIKNFDAILNIFTRPQRLHFADEANYIVFGPEAEPPLMVESGQSLNISDWVRYVRSNYKREISHQYSRITGIDGLTIDYMLDVYLLDSAIEQQIEVGADPEHLRKVLFATFDEIGNKSAIVLTTQIVRRKYWELVHRELPGTAVLAYQELSPYLDITPLARISL